ncbi:DUF2971 domain-containing protein [Gordonia sp. GONU]|nr:DUF2971 domain-containing protein [Gordonia sp. GONU]
MSNVGTDDTDILYHYTSGAGLRGIVDQIGQASFPKVYATEGHAFYTAYTYQRTLRFQASDVRFMNDHAELKTAGQVFAQKIENAASATGGGHQLLPLALELRAQGFLPDPAQVFAASFSTQSDDLSQWRGYAGGAGGFAIGIPKVVLRDHTYPMFNRPAPEDPLLGFPAAVDLVEMSYTPAAIEHDADEFISRYANGPALGPHDLAIARFEMAKHLAQHKDDSFKAEQEFRVMTHTAPPVASTSPLFGELRIGGYGLTPFTTFAINLGTHWRPAAETTIARLIIGPGPYQELQLIAARQLLAINGHDPDVAETSTITFRG